MDKKPNRRPPPRWRVWLALWWRWLIGGPNLVVTLARVAVRAESAQRTAEEEAREARREVFKNWNIAVTTKDGTVIRIHPAQFLVSIEGPMTEAAYSRLKECWKESSLLIRLPFPCSLEGGLVREHESWTVRSE